MDEPRRLTSEDICDIFGWVFLAFVCILCVAPLIMIFLIITHDIKFSDTLITIGNIGIKVYYAICIIFALAALSCYILACIQERKEKKEQEKREIVNMVLMEMQRRYKYAQENAIRDEEREVNEEARKAYRQTALVRQRLSKSSEKKNKKKRKKH